jgi:hypothetical protein
VSIEHDRAAIAHAARSQPADGASKHAPAHGRAPIVCLKMKIHERSWQQAVPALDERTACRDVDHRHFMPRPDTGEDDAVVAGPPSVSAASIDVGFSHDGFQCLDAGSNFRIRVRPVSPEIRTTYWVPVRPRM